MVIKLHKYSTDIELFVVQFRNVYAKSSAHGMFISNGEYNSCKIYSNSKKKFGVSLCLHITKSQTCFDEHKVSFNVKSKAKLRVK